jgi:hypothetical protein
MTERRERESMERKDGEIETQKNKKKTIFAHSGM